jgi:hypothetical protein
MASDADDKKIKAGDAADAPPSSPGPTLAPAPQPRNVEAPVSIFDRRQKAFITFIVSVAATREFFQVRFPRLRLF